jgi:hypothetical protein
MWHLYQLIRWEYMHEILHFLSGCAGGFVGCWMYFGLANRRKK